MCALSDSHVEKKQRKKNPDNMEEANSLKSSELKDIYREKANIQSLRQNTFSKTLTNWFEDSFNVQNYEEEYERFKLYEKV